jgi:hypothetical protein
VTRSASYSTGTTLQLALAYQNTFGDHNVDGKIIHEEIYSEWDNFNASRILKLNAEDLFAGETNGQTGSGGTPGDRSQSAYIGRVNYDYAGKYLLTLIGRYEGNSRWPAKNRWGFFPSVAVGWRLSKKKFY